MDDGSSSKGGSSTATAAVKAGSGSGSKEHKSSALNVLKLLGVSALDHTRVTDREAGDDDKVGAMRHRLVMKLACMAS